MRSLHYHYFDPAPCGFAKPRVPVLPRMSFAMFGNAHSADYPSAFTGGEPHFYTRGRYALLDAYRMAGVGRQGALLAPAYHCRTMLDPAISLDAGVGLYPLSPDLSPDMPALVRMVDGAGPDVSFKALLLTHYFGMSQETGAIVEFCRDRGLALIEDCSHACFGVAGDRTIGTIGDYAVASPYKFFALQDGGILVANRGAALPASMPLSPGPGAELRGMGRGVKAALERWRDRVQSGDIACLDGALGSLCGRSLPKAVEFEREEGTYSSLYDKAEEGRGGLSGSRWLMRSSDVARLARRRRTHYRRWAEAVDGLPNCRALFPNLPDACVPYMFPLYIDHPAPHFDLLKHLGVPLWRWDEMAVSACKVASDYRLHLIHLPCHQNLHPAEMDWMIAALSAVMRMPEERGA